MNYSVNVEKHRIVYIDLLRGYAILLVIIQHCWKINEDVGKLILSFHMPLFFFISGFLLRYKEAYNKDGISFIVDLFKKLIVPYFTFEMINLAISLVIRPYYKNALSETFALQSIFLCINNEGYEGLMNNRLWFFEALFVAECLLYFICRFLKFYKKDKKYYYILVSMVCFAGSFGMQVILDKRLPFTIDIAVMALAYMCLGYATVELIENYRASSKKLYAVVLFFSFLVLLLCTIPNEPVLMYLNQYGNYLLFIMGSFAGIAFSVTFVFMMITLKKNYHIVMWLSRNSLLIYPIHLFILSTVCIWYNKRKPYYNGVTATVLYLICCLVGSYMIVEFIHKVKKAAEHIKMQRVV